MTQRPQLVLLAASLLCACGKVSSLGHGKDSTTNGTQAGGGTAMVAGSPGGGSSGGGNGGNGGSGNGGSGNGGASTSSGGAAGSGLAGMGGRLVDPECASAVKIEGNLQVSSGS